MRLEAEWITRPETQAVTAMLSGAGYQALFVGGCVRNTLLRVPVTDIDIATDAAPERVMELASAAGLHPVPTGIDHGTVTVVSGHIPHEVTTFRRDVETDGRRAVIAYAEGPEEDAHRRDFTMNALYADAAGQIVDPLGGLADLQARRVRFIDDADLRIREDYLRILRFFRFHAWYGDPMAGLDAEGLSASAANSAGIEALSRERIGAEMRKLLTSPDPAPSVAAMVQAGILARVLPGADAKALPILIDQEAEAGTEPDPIRRLAALGGEAAAEGLRLSRKEARQLERLRDATGSGRSAAALGHYLGGEAARDVLLLRAALMEQPMPEAWHADVLRGSKAVFPVTAADLMPALSGTELGARLKELEARWVASDFTLDKAQLLT